MKPDHATHGRTPRTPIEPWAPPADVDRLRAVRKRAIRRALFAAFLVLLAVAGLVYGLYGLVGWGTVPTNKYVGEWQLRGDDGKVATLTLGADGSLAATNVPREIFSLGQYTELDWKNTVDLGGEWESYGPASITVHVDEVVTTTMWIQGRDWGMTLNIRGADADSAPIAFERAP